MSRILSATISLSLSALTLYAARKSYTAIVNLRKYEERSERAAKHSDTAAHELYKTRVTQASSAAAIAFSLVSSLAVFLGITIGSPASPTVRMILSPLNVTAIVAAFVHNRTYWKAKAKVPFVGGYNEGIESSKEIRQMMVLLVLGWGIVGAFQWMGT